MSDAALPRARVVFPGDDLGPAAEVAGGSGTRVAAGRVLATLFGAAAVDAGEGGGRRVSVVTHDTVRSSIVPAVKDIVVARVVRISPRMANLEIVSVGGVAVPHPFAAVIRKVDVRELEVDKVEMAQCFLPGDVVRAEVLSLGDSRSYFLTTARPELGVVHALSVGGAVMVPIDWEQMQCPVTKQMERRKVARLVA